MKKNVSWIKIVLVLVIALIPVWYRLFGLVFMSPSGLAPEKIGDFRLIVDEDSVYCYFTLLDSKGNYTAIDGKARIKVYDGRSGASLGALDELINREYRVEKERFRKTGIGYFPFHRTVILYPLFKSYRQGLLPGSGRISCSLVVSGSSGSWDKTIEIDL